MPALNFLPLATDAWLADTAHLTRAERGLYHDLLVLMWRTPECRVPNDMAWIARRLRCDAGEIDTLRSIVSEFCSTTGNWLTQRRLKSEWQRALASVEKQRERANARWEKDKEPCRGNAALHLSGNAPTPTPTPTIKENPTIVGQKKVGSRLPDDWQPDAGKLTPAFLAHLRAAIPGEEDRVAWLDGQAEMFRDYWHSATRGALKLDWDAAFRVWLRKGLEDVAGRRRNIEHAARLRAAGGIHDPVIRDLAGGGSGVMGRSPD